MPANFLHGVETIEIDTGGDLATREERPRSSFTPTASTSSG